MIKDRMAIFRSEADEPICTLDNMCPEWIRILDGRFKSPTHDDLHRAIRAERSAAKYRGIRVAIWDQNERIEFSDFERAADYMDIPPYSLPRIINHGQKVRKHWSVAFIL